MGNKRGQAIIEFVLSLGFFLLLIKGLLATGQYLLTKQRVHAVARLGTWLQSTKLVSEEQIKAELEDYSGKNWDLRLGRYLESPSSRFYRLYFTEVNHDLGDIWKISDKVVAQR